MTPLRESLRCPGMHDLAPEEMIRFRLVERVFRAACEGWGFQEIRTPVVEHLHLFTSAGTLSPQMLGRVYSFLDWDGWSGERVVLRPDATIPAARLYWERFRDQVAKLYYVENIFRFAPLEERREVWQCGAELIGDSWPLGDLEAIDVVRRVLLRLGFRAHTLRLSHTGIVRAILATAGYTPDEQLVLYDRMLEGDLGVFGEVENRLPKLGAPLAMLTELAGANVDGLENLRSAFASSLPLIVQPIDELRSIAATLTAAGCAYKLDLTMLRGFEYYTGPVFQMDIDGENVAGGGRYDGLVSAQDGHSVPACGFAISMDPLIARIPDSMSYGRPQIVQVRADEASPNALAAALTAASELQDVGYCAELVTHGQSPDCRWRVSVNAGDQGTRYQLEDCARGSTAQFDSSSALVAALASGATT